jgi:pimeloyl-ACP methyl ester carboxylesterase
MKRSNIIALSVLALLGVAAAVTPLIRSREHSELDDVARARAPGRYVSLTHGKTHYQALGPDSGQAVVLVHGFSIPSFVWDSTAGALAAAGFRVVRYDLWGRGLSDRPHAVYDSTLFTQQLREVIDSLHVRKPVDLVGLASGGTVAAHFTARNPTIVRKVVLIDPLSDQTDIKALNMPVLGDYVMRAVIVPSLPQQIDKYVYRPEAAPALRARFEDQMQYKGFARAMLSTARHFNQEDHSASYRALAGRPVLMISGASDAISALKQGGDLRQWIEPEFLLVEQAGHLPQYERPQIVNPALIKFLSK